MKHIFRLLGQRLEPEVWHLPESEQRQASQVLRLQPGAVFEIGDGQGYVALCAVIQARKRQLEFEVRQESWHPPPAAQLTLAIGLLKPASLKSLIPQIVELGVANLMFFAQPHFPGGRREGISPGKLTAISHEAAKVAKVNHLPQITVHDNLEAVLDITSKHDTERFYGAMTGQEPIWHDGWGQRDCICALGSEAGLSVAEEELLQQHEFMPARLGMHVLRATTAALALAAAWSLKRGCYDGESP